MKKDNILVFVRYYLPGYKAGGPVVSISEFIKKLNKYANFYVITSDRDFLDNNSYKNIKVNKWNSKFNVLINYVSNNYFDYIKVLLITLKKKKYNTYYFSSLFDFKFTILPILFSKILFIRNKRIIIAPRGELYPGALKLKRNKKLFFLRFVKIINLFSNVVWHATSEDEKKVIRNIFPKSTILISLNFYETLNTKIKLSKSNHIDDKIRIIYYSRITPKKNLK